jgi:predicted permease
MRWWHELKYLIRKLNRRRSEHEVEEEIQSHLESETREQIEAGHSPEEARYAARRAFGSVAIAKEDSREVWGLRLFEVLWQDLRYGLRMMRKRRGFTLIAIGMVAIGVAANTAVFSIADGLILRPFDYPNQDRLVMIWTQSRSAGYHHKFIPPPLFTDWQEQNQGFEQLVRFTGRLDYLTGAHGPEQVWGNLVSANFFAALGIKAALGRTFQKREDEPGRNNVVVLRHSFWQRRFNSDPEIVGKTMSINDRTYTIIGVMPEKFNFPAHFDGQFWTPFTLDEQVKHNYIERQQPHNAFGLLKPGVSVEQAGAELSSLLRRTMPPDTQRANADPSAQVVGMTDDYVRDTKKYLPPLIATVAFVLLIVCANLANMLFSRALGRRKEIAVRLALGASRRRLIGQMLTESMLLALAGGLIGLLLSILAVYLLKEAIPEEMARFTPGFERLGINRIALIFNLVITMFTGVLFGLAPAWQSSKPNLNESLKEGRKGTSSAGLRSRLRGALVIGEVALSVELTLAVVLLVGAGLLLKSLWRLLDVPLGFNPKNVLAVTINLPQITYREPFQQAQFAERLLDRLKNVPGPEAVGISTGVPLLAIGDVGIYFEGRSLGSELAGTTANYYQVSPGYLRLMQIRLVRGRLFTEHDSATSPPVVLINETMARRFFADEDPIGKRLDISGPTYMREIVGVVGDVKQESLRTLTPPQVYEPFSQKPGRSFHVLLRVSAKPAQFAETVRQEVRAIDNAQPISEARPMEAIVAQSLTRDRFSALILGAFGCLALILAAVGIYGVIAYSVAQRTNEIGVRMALGAQGADVLWLVLRQGLRLVIIGIGIGLLISVATTRVLAAVLFGISPTDPLIFGTITLLLVLVALLACWIPARRATKVDPLVALRAE